MKKIVTIISVLLIFMSTYSWFSFAPVVVASPYWLSGRSYRRAHNIVWGGMWRGQGLNVELGDKHK